MKNNFVKGLLAFLAVLASVTAAIAIMLKVFKKFFNISVEFSPKYENEECDCGECELLQHRIQSVATGRG